MNDFYSHYDKVCYIMNLIDSKITKLRPNYGYIEKLSLSTHIVQYNNYLLPTDDVVIETMNLILDGKKR